jgi:hypothetical protein
MQAAVTKKSREDAYRCVRLKLSASHARWKDHYDKKVHGKPFAVKEMV